MFQGKPSKVEAIKQESRHLRGTIGSELSSEATGFSEADKNLIKFHGIYQGYDRDSATALKQRGEEKQTEFMVRIRAPGGIMQAEQYRAVDALARDYSGGAVRISSRQGLQFHGLAKGALKPVIAGVNRALMTTFAACGDVVRNVTATAAPIKDAVHDRIRADAVLLSTSLLPQTRAYHEIWVDGAEVGAEPAEPATPDPLYGTHYLPRKFKIGIATSDDNHVDVLTNDLAIVPLFEGETLIGYNIAVGGGLGMTHTKAHTYPRLASFVAFIGPDSLLALARAVIGLHRDFGDRSDRKHARLKYVVDAMGLAAVKADLERRLGRPLEDPRPMAPFAIKDHTGWHPQGDGRWYFGLTVPSGRIVDRDGVNLASALRQLAADIPLHFVFTPTQDVLFADIAPDDRDRVETILRTHGVALPLGQSGVRRWALACPALPTCGLALNEAERVLDRIVGAVEGVLERHGLDREALSLRITGCPNGCARPYVGDIGLVGRTPDTYAIYLGGDFACTRLNVKAFEKVHIDELADTLDPLIAHWAVDRQPGEGFGDFCHRIGLQRLRGADAATVAA